MIEHYTFTKYFANIFTERTGLPFDEDNRACILAVCQNTEGHSKVDDHNRSSTYYTTIVGDKLLTIVCDSKSKKIVTVIEEKNPRWEKRKVQIA